MLDTATLMSEKNDTLFSFGERTLKFRAPKSLKRYRKVNKWNAGYIEVEAEYDEWVEEEYIDLIPILEDLYIDVKEFLTPIKGVTVAYG